MTVEAAPQLSELDVSGMTCASCVRRVERALSRVDGVQEASVNLATERATVHGTAPKEALIAAVERAGYEASPVVPQDAAASEDLVARQQQEARRRLVDLTLGIALTIPVLLLSMFFMDRFAGEQYVLLGLTLPIWLYVGRGFHLGAVKAARHGAATMDTLVAVGSSVAFLYSVWATVFRSGADTYYDTAAAIITLISIGKWLEARARGEASQAIKKLAGLQAKSAHLLRDGGEVEVPIDRLRVGDIVLVRPGERVPVDGVVLTGRSTLDESMMTGESMPVPKTEGDELIGGTVNADGLLTVRATRVGKDTALSQIIRLVEQAQGSRAPAQLLADRISQIFVPAVLVIASLTFAGWLLTGHSGVEAMIAAVAVLVIACPCALGLATPTAVMVGTGRGAEQGILIRGGESLERVRLVSSVVLDKTGTITRGEPAVTDLVPLSGVDTRELLRLAAEAEQGSEHPLARAVVRAAREADIRLSGPLPAFQAVAGQGVRVVLGNRSLLVGSRALMEQEGVGLDGASSFVERLESQAKTAFLVAVDGRMAGVVAVADTVKEGSREAVEALQRLGLEVIMLTGDSRRTAEAIAAEAGIDRVLAEVSPADKAAAVRTLQEEGKVVAMVGDGINDAPALAQADAGIAMGAGTDIAMEAADITLVHSDLRGVVAAIGLSRATVRAIRQNLFWALIYNVALIPLAAAGRISPIFAAAAMALSSVTVVSNSLRLRGTSLARAVSAALFLLAASIVVAALILSWR
jgi:Cu+-exporting ATPase